MFILPWVSDICGNITMIIHLQSKKHKVEAALTALSGPRRHGGVHGGPIGPRGIAQAQGPDYPKRACRGLYWPNGAWFGPWGSDWPKKGVARPSGSRFGTKGGVARSQDPDWPKGA